MSCLHLRLLLWKNFTLRRRQKIRAAIEVTCPLFLFLILVLVRTNDLIDRNHECHFDSKALPSSGFMPFIQSYVCTAPNTCRNDSASDDFVGRANSFDQSALAQLVKQFELFVSLNDSASLAQLLQDYQFLQNFSINKLKEESGSIDGNMEMGTLFKDHKSMRGTFAANGVSAQSSATFLNASSTPYFVLSIAKIAYNNYGKLTVFLGDDDWEKLVAIDLLLEQIQKEIFCSRQAFLKSFEYASDPVALSQMGDEFCYLRKENWNHIWIDVLLSQEHYINKPYFVDGMLRALHNITGVHLSLLDATELMLFLPKLVTDFKQSGLLPIAKNVIGIFGHHFQHPAASNSSSESNSTETLDVISWFTCGQFGSAGMQQALLQRPGMMQRLLAMRERYIHGPSGSIEKRRPPKQHRTHVSISEQNNRTVFGSTNGSAFGNVSVFYDDEVAAAAAAASLHDHVADDMGSIVFVCSAANHTVYVDKDKEDDCEEFLDALKIPAKFSAEFVSILRGHILVSPNNPATERIVEKLNVWLNTVRFLRDSLDVFLESAESFNKTLVNSTMAEAALNLLDLVLRVQEYEGIDFFGNSSILNVFYVARDLFSGLSDNYTVVEDLQETMKVPLLFLKCFRINRFVMLPNERAVEKIGRCLIDANSLLAGLVFDFSGHPINAANGSSGNGTDLPPLTIYKIRMDSTLVDNTRALADRSTNKAPRGRPFIDLKYLYYGFSFLQNAVDRAIIELQTGRPLETGVYMQQFPTPCYQSDAFVIAIKASIPLFMTITWIYTVAMIVRGIVYEKENRLKEFMKVMGLSSSSHWTAWFIQSFVPMFFSCILISIIIKYGRVIQYTDFFILLLFLICFAIATICFSFLISVFFSRANLAAACGGILYFMAYMPYSILIRFDTTLSYTGKMISCLLSNVAFGYGCSYLGSWEYDGAGVNWANLNRSPNLDDDFNFLIPMLMLLVDAAIYFLLACYIEQVFPGQYGIPQPWYFPLQRSFWFGTHVDELTMPVDVGEQISTLPANKRLEPEPTNLPLGVCVRSLRKVYSNGKVAVDCLSLNFYEGHITSFLGHNGAGKTTTLSILSGLFPPTAGAVQIYGKDIRRDLAGARKSFGMCPQHNVLFDYLTVEEQLWFYAALKHVPKEKLDAEVENMLSELNLLDKRNEMAENLSGGMQRKLSIAIAFIGGSKTVVLDEPTAGIDPYARRGIWDLVLRHKPGRTIILSTHHMDEADLLGDRIAMISAGQLRCCGSSLFLKKEFGSGYYLTLVKRHAKGEDDSRSSSAMGNSSSVSQSLVSLEDNLHGYEEGNFQDAQYADENVFSLPAPDNSKRNKTINELTPAKLSTPTRERHLDAIDKRVQQLIESHIPGAQLVDSTGVGGELTFTIQTENAELLHGLFSALDANLRPLGIKSYGVSDTTLEEIFLRVVGVDDEEGLADEHQGCACFKTLKRRVMRATGLRRGKSAKPSLSNGINSANSADGPDLNDSTDESADETESRQLTDESTNAFGGAEHPGAVGKAKRTGLSCRICHRQFFAIFIKRFHNFRRSLKGAFCEIFLPAIFIAVTMALANIVPSASKEQSLPPLLLVPWLFRAPNYIFYSLNTSDPIGNKDSIAFMDALNTFPGVGVRCMSGEPLKGAGYECNPRIDEEIIYRRTERLTSFYGQKYNSDPDVYSSFMQSNNDSNRVGNCVCTKDAVHVCDTPVYANPPPGRLTNTSDYLLNVTAWNVSLWLLDTFEQYGRHRFGGFSFGELNQVALNTSWNQTWLRSRVALLEQLWVNFTQIAGLHFPKFKTSGLDFLDEDSVFFRKISASENVSGDPDNSTSYNFTDGFMHFVSGMEVRNNIKVWFNNKGWPSAPTYANVLSNAMLRARLTAKQNPADYGIVTYNHPMNFSVQQLNQKQSEDFNEGLALTIAVATILAFSFVPASFVLFLIDERMTNTKHLQFVSGLSPALYWFANFAWDLMNYCIPMFIAMIIYACFNEQAYIGTPRAALGTMALIFLFGFATTPLMYLFSFLFRVPSAAFVSMACANLFIGMITTISVQILERLSLDKVELKPVSDALSQFFLIFPQYCFGVGLINMKRDYMEYIVQKIWFGEANVNLLNPFGWEQCGDKLFYMFLVGVIAFATVILIEYRFCCRSKFTNLSPDLDDESAVEEDEDVAFERKRVTQGHAEDCVVKILNLSKNYRKQKLSCCCCPQKQIHALSQLCLGIEPGECFGLLGVNGAGKTTTFKILTGKTQATSGDAFFLGHSVGEDLTNACRSIGYCPQFDALNSLLTGAEHLAFYARLRGISERNIPRVVKWGIKQMHLKQYANRVAGTYSGGNKRKLSTAIALIGNPSVILLDEPTTGMDPKARRFLWNKITEVVREGRSVILTSHSMEECEALCNRIGILVNGQLQCLGSVQHLKSRFGGGYTMTLKLAAHSAGPQAVKDFVEQTFPGAELKESHNTMLEYQLPHRSIPVSAIFKLISDCKQRLGIEDYSVSQTTLDQVFINFAKRQTGAQISHGSGRFGKSLRSAGAACCCCLKDVCPPDELPLDDRSVAAVVGGGSSRPTYRKTDEERTEAKEEDNKEVVSVQPGARQKSEEEDGRKAEGKGEPSQPPVEEMPPVGAAIESRGEVFDLL